MEAVLNFYYLFDDATHTKKVNKDLVNTTRIPKQFITYIFLFAKYGCI